MAKDPAILFYTSDFLTGTMTMTHEQVGKYIRLLCLQHQKGSLSIKDFQYICGQTDQDIMSKFEKDGETYYNVRLREEAEKRANYAQSRRENRLKKSEKQTVEEKTKETHEKDMSYISDTYVKHMENENENENKDIIIIDNKINNASEKIFIDAFNECFDKKFTLTEESKKNIKKIIKAGYTVEDAKAVFFLKNEQWKNKPDMKQYLVPKTLLRFSKFEEYVQEVRNVNINDLKQLNGTIKPNGKMSVFDPAFNEDINNWLKETYGDGTNEI